MRLLERSRQALALCYAGVTLLLALAHLGFAMEIAWVRDSLAPQWLACFLTTLALEYVVLDSFHFALVKIVLAPEAETPGSH